MVGVVNVVVIFNGNGMVFMFCIVIISEIFVNVEVWELILVEVKEVIISGGSIYNGNLMVIDVLGFISMFMCGVVSFFGFFVLGGNIDIVVVVLEFNFL